MRSFLRTTLIALSALAVALGGALPALGHDHTVTDSEYAFGGLLHERFSIRLGDGSWARGNILRFQQDDEYLQLRSTLARDRVSGVESMPDLWTRVGPRDAVAGTNGGFWLRRPDNPGDAPYGAPNGFTVSNQTVLTGRGQTFNGHNRPRGTVGIQASGAVLLDRLNATAELSHPGHDHPVPVDEVNLQPRVTGDERFVPDGELIVYDRLFGVSSSRIYAPAGSRLITVDGLRLRPTGWASGTVTHVRTVFSDTAVELPPNGSTLVLAHGTARSRVDGVALGQTVSARVRPRPAFGTASAWNDVVSAMPGGPLLLTNGQRTEPEEWLAEGFRLDSEGIMTTRNPRTAVGLTSTGEVLMVTVDGRQPGHSVGMTISELQRFMEGLGARHALNLDGGGPTTMMVGGRITNRPSTANRAVANGLFVHHSYPFDGTRRIAGGDRYATAGAIANRSHPDGASQVVITTGANFPDALAGGPLAAVASAPLLLTTPHELHRATIDALDRLQPTSALILGGTGAVSDEVRRQLEARGITVVRTSDTDRYGTAAEIGRAAFGNADLDRVFIATGAGFADALSAAAPAAMLGAPILLTRKDRLPDATRAFLSERDVGELVIVGGTGVVSEAVEDELHTIDASTQVTRLSGRTRYGTARAVNEWAEAVLPSHDDRGLLVANGRNFPDALAGGPLAAQRTNLLMIVPPRDVLSDADAEAYLEARGNGPLNRITLLGGRSALNLYQQWQLDQIVVN